MPGRAPQTARTNPKTARPGGTLLLLALLLLPGCFIRGKELPREAVAGPGAESGTALAPSGGEAGDAAAAAAVVTAEAAGPGGEARTAEPPRMALVPEEVRPGEPFVVAFAPGPERAGIPAARYRAALCDSRGERIAEAAFFSLGTDAPDALAAALAVPSTLQGGEALALIAQDGTTLGELTLRVLAREFASEEIALDQRNTEIRTLPDPQKNRESEELMAVIQSAGTEIFASGPFAPPVSSTRRTSFYGDRRVYRYANGGSAAAIHAGVDYGVPTGTEVRACAAGKVALAGRRIATGNSVVLEHLPGVYSLYYHLDSIEVAPGSLVQAGEPLGKSGSTGLATGPHLHWEIRVSGENADPDAFLSRAVLDKDAILSTLSLVQNSLSSGPSLTGH